MRFITITACFSWFDALAKKSIDSTRCRMIRECFVGLNTDQTRMVQSMADEQLALQLSTPGIGLAQALIKQIQGQGGGAVKKRMQQCAPG